jgi:hypothetical protein
VAEVPDLVLGCRSETLSSHCYTSPRFGQLSSANWKEGTLVSEAIGCWPCLTGVFSLSCRLRFTIWVAPENRSSRSGNFADLLFYCRILRGPQVGARPADRMISDPVHKAADITPFPGSRIVERWGITPGPDPSVYAYVKSSMDRNLFRIPLRHE